MIDMLTTWHSSGNEKKILLLRHGEVVESCNEKRFIGQIDLPLSDTGRYQARYWQKYLASFPLEGIVCSDLSRCMETARIIAANRPIAVTKLPELREIQLGQWDGMTFAQVKDRWPDAFRQRGLELASFRPPKGESFQDLQQRVVPAFKQAVTQTRKNILFVAHAGVNRMILCHLLGIPVENLFSLSQGCGAMNLIDRLDSGYLVRTINLLPN